MKRKKVMRLLAVAMAASLAVTSQGIPAGLTAVYAADAKAQEDLSGGYYVNLTSFITEHTHTAAAGCYSEPTAKDVTAADNYYTVTNGSASDLSSKYTKVDKTAVIKPGTDVEYDLTDKYVVTSGNPGEETRTVHDVVTDQPTLTAIQDAQAATEADAASKSSNITDKNIIKIETSDLTNLNTAAGSNESAKTSVNDETKVVFNSAKETGTLTDGAVYQVIEYVKNNDASSEVKGKITIKDEPTEQDKADYATLLGINADAVNAKDVYVPLTVVKYVPDFSSFKADGTETVEAGSDSTVSYTYVTIGTDKKWITTAESETKPDTDYYQWDTEKNNFVIHIADKILSDDDDNELDASKNHDATYDYTTASDDTSKLVIAAVTAQNDASILSGSINEKNTNVVKNSGTYYLDVTKYFISGIALTNPTATNTRYIATGYDETNIDDALTLTYKDSTDGAAHTATLEKGEVTNSYTGGTEATSANVTGFVLGGKEFYYVADSGTTGVIETSEVKKLSDLKSAENIASSGLAGEGIAIPLTKLDAGATVSVATTPEATETAYQGSKVFLTTESPKVTATISEASEVSGYKWVYAWSDKVGEAEKNTTAATEKLTADNVTNTGYNVDTNTIGTHTIKLVSKLVKTDDETSVLATIESAAVTVYIVTEDDTVVDFSGNKEYTGSAIAVPTVTPKSGQTVTINYEGNGDTSYTKTTDAPTNVGEYSYTVEIAADIPDGYKATTKTGSFTIVPKQLTAKDSKLVDSYDNETTQNNTHEVDLSSILIATEASSAAVGDSVSIKEGKEFKGTGGDNTIFASVGYVPSTGVLTYVLNDKAVTATSASTLVTEDITGTLVVGGYEIAVTYTVKINKDGYTTTDITLNAANDSAYYYGDKDSTYDPKTDLISSPESTGTYTFTYKKQGEAGAAESNTFPTAAGTYDVTINYENNNNGKITTGEANTTITINKKAVTVTIKQADSGSAASIVESATDAVTTVPAVTIETQVTQGTTDVSSTDKEALLAAVTYTKSDDSETTAPASVSSNPGVYTLGIDDTNFKDNYTLNVTGSTTLTVQKILNLTAKDVTSVVNNAPKYDYTLTDKSGATADLPSTATVKYALSNNGGSVNGNPTTAGEYTITPSFEFSGGAESLYEVKATTGTLTVVESAIKVDVTAADASITAGNSFTPTITVTPSEGGDALTNVATSYVIYKQGDEAKTPVTTFTTAGTYIIEPSVVDTDTYEATPTNGTLTVSAAPTYNPPADTDKTPSDTTEPTIKENEDGTKTIVDADGKVIANDKVTIDGKSYITDENGEVLTSQIAETPSGNKVYVGKDGAIVKNKTVTYDGKKYYATGSGKIATNKFVTTAKGNKVYATKTGALKVSKTFTVNGKKYYAKASGAIATTGFVKTASGNTVYATKSGALKVNKAFKAADGKKYVADKNGKIVKGKKITIGNKTYTTNKKGVIIKVTTKKK
jgi:hypothetical protein